MISRRHLAKTITWRLVGSLDTLFLSWIISGSIETGAKIGAAELISKMVLYYIHERVWFKSKRINTNKRHLLKTFSWRAVGTLDTIALAWIFTGDPLLGLTIGISEVATKMILYYFHEKIWYKISFGLKRN